jgi:hypothetical protein
VPHAAEKCDGTLHSDFLIHMLYNCLSKARMLKIVLVQKDNWFRRTIGSEGQLCSFTLQFRHVGKFNENSNIITGYRK